MNFPPPLLLFALVLALAGWALPVRGSTIVFNDGFEGAGIDPFWTVSQSFGSISTSSAQVHSGAQSVQVSSIPGGQREMWLTHIFANPVQGNFSIWFYDYAPGQQTLYEAFSMYNSSQPTWGAGLGTMDFDAFCYAGSINGAGPNASCGSYPQSSTTNVVRTLGWHQLSINVLPAATTLLIDSNPVYSLAGNYSFDRLDIHFSGPFWRPDTIAYYDDFSMQAEEVVPEPGSFLLCAPLLGAGMMLRRRKGRRG